VEIANPQGGSTLMKAVKINGENIPIDNEGRFSKTGISFVLQENQTGVISISAADLVKNINVLDVTLKKDTTGPELFVTSFQNGVLTNNPAPITVAGVARDTTQVVVNGVTVPVVSERFE
ncbi:hypothetical protein RZS08_47785, partial [Arthrospira platensis SPKY1]|nr:hypothetical protein [Arthrospira platensis SPKY1]